MHSLQSRQRRKSARRLPAAGQAGQDKLLGPGSPVLAAAARKASTSRASVAGLGCAAGVRRGGCCLAPQPGARAEGCVVGGDSRRPAQGQDAAPRGSCSPVCLNRQQARGPCKRAVPHRTRADSACSWGLPPSLRPPSRGSKGSGLPGWAGRGQAMQRACSGWCRLRCVPGDRQMPGRCQVAACTRALQQRVQPRATSLAGCTSGCAAGWPCTR